MDLRRLKWNKRYANVFGKPHVDEHLVTFAKTLKVGKALDVACGLGQNALFLRDLGWEVDAIDISDKAIETLLKERNISAICMDINDFSWPYEAYDLIVNINFLERFIFSYMIEAIRPGGYLFFKTFTYRSHHINPRYALKQNELLKEFDTLEIERYELLEDGRALMIAKKSSQ